MACTEATARRILAAETISMAFVIFLVLPMDLILLLISRVLFAMNFFANY
jgi:hypothetical protein